MAIGETPADRDLLGPLNGQVVVPPPSDPAVQRPSPYPERAPLRVVYGDNDDDGFTLAEDAALLRPDKRQMLLDAGDAAQIGTIPSPADRTWLRSVIDEDHEDEFLSKIQNNEPLTPASMFAAASVMARDINQRNQQGLPLEWRIDELENQSPGIKAAMEAAGLDPKTGLLAGEQGPQRGEAPNEALSRGYGALQPPPIQKALRTVGNFFNVLDEIRNVPIVGIPGQLIHTAGDIAWWSEERIGDLQQAMGEGARESLVAEEWEGLRAGDPTLLDEQMGQKERGRALQARMGAMEQNLPEALVTQLDRTVGASLNAPTRIRALQHIAALTDAMDQEAERFIAEQMDADAVLASGLTSEGFVDQHLEAWLATGMQAIMDHFGDPKKQILIEGVADPLNIIDLFDPFGGPLPVLATLRGASRAGVRKTLLTAAGKTVAERRSAKSLTDFMVDVQEHSERMQQLYPKGVLAVTPETAQRQSTWNLQDVGGEPWPLEDVPEDIWAAEDPVRKELLRWTSRDYGPAFEQMVEEINTVREAAGLTPVEILTDRAWIQKYQTLQPSSEMTPEQSLRDRTRHYINPNYKDGFAVQHQALEASDLSALSQKELRKIAAQMTFTERLPGGRIIDSPEQFGPQDYVVQNLHKMLSGTYATSYAKSGSFGTTGAVTMEQARQDLVDVLTGMPIKTRSTHHPEHDIYMEKLQKVYDDDVMETMGLLHHIGATGTFARPVIDLPSGTYVDEGWKLHLSPFDNPKGRENYDPHTLSGSDYRQRTRALRTQEVLEAVAITNPETEAVRSINIQKIHMMPHSHITSGIDIYGVGYMPGGAKSIDPQTYAGLGHVKQVTDTDPIWNEGHTIHWVVFDPNGIPVASMNTTYTPGMSKGPVGTQFDLSGDPASPQGMSGPYRTSGSDYLDQYGQGGEVFEGRHSVNTMAADGEGIWVAVDDLMQDPKKYKLSPEQVNEALRMNQHGRYVGHIDDKDSLFALQFPNEDDLTERALLFADGDDKMAGHLNEGFGGVIGRSLPEVMDQVGDTGLNALGRPYGGRPIVVVWNDKQYVRLRPKASASQAALSQSGLLAIMRRSLEESGHPVNNMGSVSDEVSKAIVNMLEGATSINPVTQHRIGGTNRNIADRRLTGRVWDARANKWKQVPPKSTMHGDRVVGEPNMARALDPNDPAETLILNTEGWDPNYVHPMTGEPYARG
jgi:hypothetical protein